MKMIIAISILGFSLLSSGCDRDLESADFNVYFYLLDDREIYLGSVKGLSACQNMASFNARSLGTENSNWSYICCLKTSSSDCAEKHK
jgi:hypothetical protein